MAITVKLSTTFRDIVPGYNPYDGIIMEAGPSATAGSIAQALGIPLKEIKIVMVNSRHASLDTPIHDGDRVAYFPPVGGG